MKLRIIGDVHGHFSEYQQIIEGCESSIQVGDMGVGFPIGRTPPYPVMIQDGVPRHRYIRGNHDNPATCAQDPCWIPDGSVANGIFCLGGATSIDKEWRTPGLTWWADEEVSVPALDKAIDFYEQVKPDVVITHECPEAISMAILAAFNKTKIVDGSRTRLALQMMLDIHQPKLWVFGHWHVSLTFNQPPMAPGRSSTKFVCLNELEYMDVDV